MVFEVRIREFELVFTFDIKTKSDPASSLFGLPFSPLLPSGFLRFFAVLFSWLSRSSLYRRTRQSRMRSPERIAACASRCTASSCRDGIVVVPSFPLTVVLSYFRIIDRLSGRSYLIREFFPSPDVKRKLNATTTSAIAGDAAGHVRFSARSSVLVMRSAN